MHMQFILIVMRLYGILLLQVEMLLFYMMFLRCEIKHETDQFATDIPVSNTYPQRREVGGSYMKR